jgi:hypothetical protein
MDGLKKNNINHGLKIINYLFNLPSGGSIFINSYASRGESINTGRMAEITEQMLKNVAGRAEMGKHIASIIADGEALNTATFRALLQKYPWLICLVCMAHALSLTLKKFGT